MTTQKNKPITQDKKFVTILGWMDKLIVFILIFIFVFIASFVLTAYFKSDGGFDIIGLWRGFYAAL